MPHILGQKMTIDYDYMTIFLMEFFLFIHAHRQLVGLLIYWWWSSIVLLVSAHSIQFTFLPFKGFNRTSRDARASRTKRRESEYVFITRYHMTQYLAYFGISLITIGWNRRCRITWTNWGSRHPCKSVFPRAVNALWCRFLISFAYSSHIYLIHIFKQTFSH